MIRKTNGLGPLYEGSQTLDIVETLTSSAVADSTTVLIKCGAMLSKELVHAMTTRDPVDRLKILEKTLADTRALRSAASKIPDDTLTDYAWSAVCAWWSFAIKYGVGALKNHGDVGSTTRESTLAKFDLLIRFLRVEIAKTKMELSKSKHGKK